MKSITRRQLLKYYVPLGFLTLIMTLLKRKRNHDGEYKEAKYYRNLAG